MYKEMHQSSSAVDKHCTLLAASGASIFSVDSRKPEALADYVRRVRIEKELSTPDVEKRSGYQITDGYVSRIENGQVKNVSPEKLRALAKGLGVLEDEVFAVARGLPHETSFDDNLTHIIGYYRDSSPATQRQMAVLCETLWREEKRAAVEFAAPESKKRSA